jgi:hypothetical protein
MYAVSSLLALQEKRKSSNAMSGMEKFEKSFNQFIQEELLGIVITATKDQLERASQFVEQLLLVAHKSQSEKDRKRIEIGNEQEEIRQLLNRQPTNYLKNRLNQEIDEFLYYIKQRVFFRLHDFFKESFSPVVLQSNDRSIQQALQSALQELLDSLSMDFVQELLATTLRVESFINKMASEKWDEITRVIRNEQESLTFPPYEYKPIEGIQVCEPFETIDKSTFKKALSMYKNPKSFFEKNEKKLMLEELEYVLQEPADAYLREEGERFKEYYSQMLETRIAELICQLMEQSDEYYNGLLSVLNDDFSLAEMVEVQNWLEISSSRWT